MLLRISTLYIIILCIFLVDSSSTFSQINTPYLKLISPNGGETWEANTAQTIVWQSSNITRVKIEYSLSGGMDWHNVVSSIKASDGQYSWILPNVKIAEVLIRISDVTNSSIFDVCDRSFSIFIKPSTAKYKQNIIQSDSSAIKIMPLGDSITEGAGDDTNQVGYRSKLFDLLQRAGYNFDFVGTQHSGTSYSANPDFNANHEGHGGMEVGHPSYLELPTMLDNIEDYLSNNTPDVVLFHMGTNDLNGGKDPKFIANQLDSVIIYHILVHNPNTSIFWARIIHDNHVSETTLNYDIGRTFTSLTPEQKARIRLVYMDFEPQLKYPGDFSKYTPEHIFADLHPIESGYNKMAEHWFVAMQAYYQPVPTLPTNNALNQPINISLKWIEPPVSSNLSIVYELQLAADSEFAEIVYDTSGISSDSINLSGLRYGTKYFWRTRIANYGWSDTLSFTTIPFSASIKVFLQGPYSGGDSMNTNLMDLPDFPQKQPYGGPPWNYNGNEVDTLIPSNVVDWVLVELRTAYNGPAVARRAAFLRKDGIVFDTGSAAINYISFSGVLPGNYYIVIKHRNHLPIMSANAVYLPNDSIYDFTSDSSRAYGKKSTVNLGKAKFGMIAGDNNNDGVISIIDYNVISNSITKSGYNISDDNMDGVVSKTDYNSVSFNLFKFSKVP